MDGHSSCSGAPEQKQHSKQKKDKQQGVDTAEHYSQKSVGQQIVDSGQKADPGTGCHRENQQPQSLIGMISGILFAGDRQSEEARTVFRYRPAHSIICFWVPQALHRRYCIS